MESACLLVGGLVVMVIAFKSMEAFKTVPPFPDSSQARAGIVEDAKSARKAVTAVGLVLVGFALMIALPWRSSPLDVPAGSLVADPGGGAEPKPGAGGGTAEPGAAPAEAAAPAAVVDAKPIATAEELLENWPALLGPAASVSRATGLLTEWDGEAGTGIKWKTAVPLPGYSSPIYWEGKLYLTGGDATTREIYCVDAETGDVLWRKKAENVPGSPARSPSVSEDTGYAAGTMATDGVRVFASFSNGDLLALDLEGNPVWSKNLGVPKNPYGYASSLITHGDALLVQFDNENVGYLAAFDVVTGEEHWKTARDFQPSWSTPAVFNTGEREEVIVAACPTVVSYDRKTGEELWRVVDCLKYGEVTAIPVYADGIVYVSADSSKLSAIDVKTREILWQTDGLTPGVSTPLVHDGLLYCGTDDGAFVCYDAKTGEEIWAEFADNGFYASPILADGRIHLLDRGGNMFILKPGRELEIISQPVLGEKASCTPAVVGDSFYIRGNAYLYRIGP